jgi:hypothetical protein
MQEGSIMSKLSIVVEFWAFLKVRKKMVASTCGHLFVFIGRVDRFY